jgi:peptidoglycan hydrolase-like protein with peptidoglycan-binding domain
MFTALRKKVIREAGFDFLTVFGDMMRPRSHVATESGVATRSRHKCGDAFDYNQGHASLVLVKEPREGRMYWRTFLLCNKQDGSQGESLRIQNQQLLAQGGAPKFYFDFTMAAEALGWHRIPAHPNWQRVWKGREFWHYQNIEGYTFDEAMVLLYGNPALVPQRPRFPTVNPGQKDDTGVNVLKNVRQVQAQLYLLKLLGPRTEVDGVYGGNTTEGVKAFQQKEGLPVTGIADEATRRLLLQRVM